MIDLRKYIGIPFINRGDSFDGADCFGLLRLFYKQEFHYIIDDPNVNAGHTSKVFAKYIIELQSNWATINEPEVYCAVAMAHDPKLPNTVQHFGIYLPNNKILHTLKDVGSHIVEVENYKWAIKAYHKWQKS